MANEYPTPGTFSGPSYAKYIKHRKDYGEITVESKFEDGGVDRLEHASDAPQRWTLIYQGLTEAERNTLLSHYNTNRLISTFTFVEPRNDPWTGTTGTSYTVQYESAPEQPEHDRYFVQSLTVHLIKFPA